MAPAAMSSGKAVDNERAVVKLSHASTLYYLSTALLGLYRRGLALILPSSTVLVMGAGKIAAPCSSLKETCETCL